MAAETITRRELVEAANDLNITLRLYPPIGLPPEASLPDIDGLKGQELLDVVNKVLQQANTRRMPESELREALFREAGELTEDDDVRPNTRKILEMLAAERGGVPPIEHIAEEAPAPEPEPKPEPKPKKKPPHKPKPEKKPKTKKIPTKKTKPDTLSRTSRTHAFAQAVKEGGTRQDVIRRAHELFVASGGSSDKAHVMVYHCAHILPTLIELGVVTLENDLLCFHGKKKT